MLIKTKYVWNLCPALPFPPFFHATSNVSLGRTGNKISLHHLLSDIWKKSLFD